MYLEGEFFTYDYVVRGYFDTTQERLSDYLNIKNETTIILYEAKLSRLLGLGKSQLVEIPEVRMDKDSILFAYPAESDITPTNIYRRANRLIYPVSVLLPNFMLVGSVHLTEKFEIRRVLLSRPDDFIPLTDVTATFSLYPALAYKKNIMVFNKNRMILIGEYNQADNSSHATSASPDTSN
jgi:hypothetical protein